MKVIKVHNYNRRDCSCDLECENCGHKHTCNSAYDDNNYWVNVIPNRTCPNCGKSTNDLKQQPTEVKTRFPEGFQV